MSSINKNKIKAIIDGLGKSSHILVETFPGYLYHKIGIEPESKYITILISAVNKEKIILHPSGGKYLTINYDVKCSIKSKGKGVQKNKVFTLITLKTKEKDIEDYFIDLCLIFMEKLGKQPQIKSVKNEFEKIESIFAKLSKASRKSIIGLWGELYLIAVSTNPKLLIFS